MDFLERLERAGCPRWISAVAKSDESFLDRHSKIVQNYLLEYVKPEALEMARKDGIGLTFIGEPGTGKSGLAAWVFGQILRWKDMGAVWTSEAKLIEAVRYRDVYDEEETWRERFVNVSLLVVDRVTIPDKTTKILWEVLAEREQERGITLITTWHNHMKMEEKHPEVGIMESLGRPVTMGTRDLRERRAEVIKGNFGGN